jgi:hypothetical protein
VGWVVVVVVVVVVVLVGRVVGGSQGEFFQTLFVVPWLLS